jgi:hypothetical protein
MSGSSRCCIGAASPPPVRPIVISSVPTSAYRVRQLTTYLFAFPVTTPSIARAVEVWLPVGRFTAGASVTIQNLSAPNVEISLSLFVGSSSRAQPPGFPLTLRAFQQQTFWWVSSGWAYAGGFGSSPPLALGGSTPSSVAAFDATRFPLQLVGNNDLIYPLLLATITSIVGDNASIFGTVAQLPGTNAVTIFGGSSDIFAISPVANGTGALYGTGGLTFNSVTADPATGTFSTSGLVTVTMESNVLWKTAAATASWQNPSERTTETVQFLCPCTITSLINGTVLDLAIHLPNVPLVPVVPGTGVPGTPFGPATPDASHVWIAGTYKSNMSGSTTNATYVSICILIARPEPLGPIPDELIEGMSQPESITFNIPIPSAGPSQSASFLFSESGAAGSQSYGYGVLAAPPLSALPPEYVYDIPNQYPISYGNPSGAYNSHYTLPPRPDGYGEAWVAGMAPENSIPVDGGFVLPFTTPLFTGYASFSTPLYLPIGTTTTSGTITLASGTILNIDYIQVSTNGPGKYAMTIATNPTNP